MFVTTAQADHLSDIQTAMRKASTGTEAVTLWNVYRMTDDGRRGEQSGLRFCERI